MEPLILITPFLVVSLIFGVVFLKNRTSLWNGALFLLWIFTAGLAIFSLLINLDNNFSNAILFILIAVLGTLVVLAISLGSLIMPIALFWNFITVKRKEKLNTANMLTLFLAIFIVGFNIVGFIVHKDFLPNFVNILFGFLSVLILYFSLSFINFLLASMLYRVIKPRLNQDYLIVLGSGLIDGEKVPPLLASRIDRAIKFFNKAKKKGFSPKIILSGGKGSDEKISEAEAMAKYALSKNIPKSSMIIEDKSTTTLENMKFSKKMMVGKNPKVVFFTNNFHVFRAGVFAKKAGLKARGVGSKTAFYFLPNAIIREFIAITVHYQKNHFIFVGLISLAYAMLMIMNFINRF